MDYKIETGLTVEELVEQVQTSIRQGWRPTGGVTVVPHPTHTQMLIQPMTKAI